MSRFHSYLNTAVKIIDGYKGDQPLHVALQQYFAAHKQMGGRDRKTVASLCYQYFRTCHALAGTKEEKIIHAVFLCELQESGFLRALNPVLADKMTLPLIEKLAMLQVAVNSIFPFKEQLSNEIQWNAFSLSFIIQPKVFVRVRPGKHQKVRAALDARKISYELQGDDCFSLPQATPVKDILVINRDVVIQDLNSQKVLNYLDDFQPGQPVSAWDCCAASGGKSILLYDKLKGNVRLTVSDIRKNILTNLQQRLQQAGMPIYDSLVADLSKQAPEMNEVFDIIICDVPCTGSGTWSRTPEQLAYFKTSSVAEYAQIQQKIASNAVGRLKKGGVFFYITCSVFAQENESVVAYLEETCQLQLVKQQYLTGYNQQADSMFVAVLKN